MKLSQQKTYPVSFYQNVTAKNISCFFVSNCHSRKHTLFPSIKLSQQKTYAVSFYQIVTAENISCFLLSNCHSGKHTLFPSIKLSQQKSYRLSRSNPAESTCDFLQSLPLQATSTKARCWGLTGCTFLWMVATPCPKWSPTRTQMDCDWPVCVHFGILRFSVLVR